MTDFFPDMEESLSPRQQWCKRHAVKTVYCESRGERPAQFKAFSLEYEASAETEAEAIDRLAQILWIKKNIKTPHMEQNANNR